MIAHNLSSFDCHNAVELRAVNSYRKAYHLQELTRKLLWPVKHLKNISRLVGAQIILTFLPLAAFIEFGPREIEVGRTGGKPHSTLFVRCQVLH